MKHIRQLVLVLAPVVLVFFAAQVWGVSVTVNPGTTFAARLVQNVNANINTAGDTIYFSVLEDVKVGTETVIAAGALVTGRVNTAEGRKAMGRAGKLDFNARQVTAVDGTTIELEKDNINVEGRARTGATVAHVIVWGPLGLFAKGRAAYVLKDTEYDLTVSREATVDPANTPMQTKLDPNIEIVAEFKPIKRKVHFAKGKTYDDLVVTLTYPENVRGPAAPESVRITEILGYELHKPVVARTLETGKDGKEKATFDWWSVFEYALPGTTTVSIQVDLAGGDLAQADTSFESIWKLK